MPNAQITVDIIIPTYKRIHLLKKELESLSSIVIPPEVTNIHVIENGGVYGARELIDNYADRLPLTYHYLEKGNLSLARNVGVEASNADFLIFFDDDMTFCKTTITAYVDAFKSYGNQCFFGGRLAPDYETRPEAWLDEFLPESAKGFSLGRVLKKCEGTPFLGGNHAVPRDALQQIGGYDLKSADGNNVGAVGEEKRMQAKLLERGFTPIYVPDALVLHYVPALNCNKEWLKQRSFRYGYTQGGIDAERCQFKHIAHIPLFCIKSLVIQMIYRCLLVLSFDKKAKFKNEIKIKQILGYISGYRETKNQQVTDNNQ